MKWEVTGADRETGEDRTLLIKADSESAALEMAARNNILVSEILAFEESTSSLPEPSYTPKTDSEPSDPADALAAMTGVFATPSSNVYRKRVFYKKREFPNPMGKSALAIGIASIVSAVFPKFVFMSLILGGIGIIMGVLGIIATITTNRCSPVLPILGAITSGLAFLIIYGSYGSISSAFVDSFHLYQNNTETTVTSPSDQNAGTPAQRQKSAPAQVKPSTDSIKPSPSGNSQNKAPAQIQSQNNQKNGTDNDKSLFKLPTETTASNAQIKKATGSKQAFLASWIDGKPGAFRDGIRVGINSSGLGDAMIKKANGTIETIPDRYIIAIELQNTDKKRKIEYTTWRGATSASQDDRATVTDDRGKSYQLLQLRDGDKLVGGVDQKVVMNASQRIIDILVIDKPMTNARDIRLELPASNFGGAGVIQLQLILEKSIK